MGVFFFGWLLGFCWWFFVALLVWLRLILNEVSDASGTMDTRDANDRSDARKTRLGDTSLEPKL